MMRRSLTAGELALVHSVFGDAVDGSKVELVRGKFWPFHPPRVAMAPMGDIYFHPDGGGWSEDFSKESLAAQGFFIHEMTHVWQYRAYGVAAFLLRYAWEFLRAGGRAGLMYRYSVGKTPFHAATLEAQAEMAADYGEAVRTGGGGRARLLAANLAGSGLYGL